MTSVGLIRPGRRRLIFGLHLAELRWHRAKTLPGPSEIEKLGRALSASYGLACCVCIARWNAYTDRKAGDCSWGTN